METSTLRGAVIGWGVCVCTPSRNRSKIQCIRFSRETIDSPIAPTPKSSPHNTSYISTRTLSTTGKATLSSKHLCREQPLLERTPSLSGLQESQPNPPALPACPLLSFLAAGIQGIGRETNPPMSFPGAGQLGHWFLWLPLPEAEAPFYT